VQGRCLGMQGPSCPRPALPGRLWAPLRLRRLQLQPQQQLGAQQGQRRVASQHLHLLLLAGRQMTSSRWQGRSAPHRVAAPCSSRQPSAMQQALGKRPLRQAPQLHRRVGLQHQLWTAQHPRPQEEQRLVVSSRWLAAVRQGRVQKPPRGRHRRQLGLLQPRQWLRQRLGMAAALLRLLLPQQHASLQQPRGRAAGPNPSRWRPHHPHQLGQQPRPRGQLVGHPHHPHGLPVVPADAPGAPRQRAAAAGQQSAACVVGRRRPGGCDRQSAQHASLATPAGAGALGGAAVARQAAALSGGPAQAPTALAACGAVPAALGGAALAALHAGALAAPRGAVLGALGGGAAPCAAVQQQTRRRHAVQAGPAAVRAAPSSAARGARARAGAGAGGLHLGAALGGRPLLQQQHQQQHLLLSRQGLVTVAAMGARTTAARAAAPPPSVHGGLTRPQLLARSSHLLHLRQLQGMQALQQEVPPQQLAGRQVPL
jgi:hypothetical protein